MGNERGVCPHRGRDQGLLPCSDTCDQWGNEHCQHSCETDGTDLCERLEIETVGIARITLDISRLQPDDGEAARARTEHGMRSAVRPGRAPVRGAVTKRACRDGPSDDRTGQHDDRHGNGDAVAMPAIPLRSGQVSQRPRRDRQQAKREGDGPSFGDNPLYRRRRIDHGGPPCQHTPE